MKFSKVLKETLKFNPFDTFRSPQLQLVKYIYETNWGKTTTIKQKYSWPSGSMDSTSADAINHEIKTILKKKKKKSYVVVDMYYVVRPMMVLSILNMY